MKSRARSTSHLYAPVEAQVTTKKSKIVHNCTENLVSTITNMPIRDINWNAEINAIYKAFVQKNETVVEVSNKNHTPRVNIIFSDKAENLLQRMIQHLATRFIRYCSSNGLVSDSHTKYNTVHIRAWVVNDMPLELSRHVLKQLNMYLEHTQPEK